MYWIFIVYGICAIIQDALAIWDMVIEVDSEVSYLIMWSSVLLFSVIEFITFYMFFYSVFLNAGIRKKILVVGISYTFLSFSILAYMLIAKKVYGSYIFSYYSVTTSFFILFPAFYYFYYLFTLPPTKDLAKERAFWINIGIIFIQGILIPFYLLGGYIAYDTSTWQKMYSINYLAYSVMFVLFSIGMLCKTKEEAKSRMN